VGQFVSREQWFDAGFATPEAAVQTVFWAMATANGPRYLDALWKPEGEPSPADGEVQKVMASIAQSFESAQGATLDAAQSSSEDEVHLRLTVRKLSADTPEGVTTTPELFVLRRVGNEWKIIPGAASLLSEPAPLEVEEAEEE
jgi:hypothetical protein